jgi:hypothetical protein
LQNKAVVYDLLFRTASETMMTIAADVKHLGARIGITAVLHTWGSAMTHHPLISGRRLRGFMRSRSLCRVGDKVADLVANLVEITQHNSWFDPPVSASPEVCRELESGLARSSAGP